MNKESGSGPANLAERQSRYVKLKARKRKKALERANRYLRLVSEYENQINVGGDPHLFDKVTGYLAQQHQVSKEFISNVRKAVKRA